MNQTEFLSKWENDKPSYKAWGEFIISQIIDSLIKEQLDPNILLKIQPKERTKDNQSLLDKAFNRGKNYKDPYNDIEDKVGIRFVVLLTDDIKKITKCIKNNNLWDATNAKDYEQEMEKEPLLFAYKSMHYILRPKEKIEYQGYLISENTACEVQIRTLLQHAHAELTHDAIYKSQKKIKPIVHRTVAKCMALIETTDSFFCDATKEINAGPIKDYKIVESLDSLYSTYTQLAPNNQKSALIILDTFEYLIDEKTIEDINSFIKRKPYLIEIINEKYIFFNIYQQSIVLFIYWLIETKRSKAKDEWPLDWKILEMLATNMGVSLDR
ncbi:GTP pyrophosphokinase family protein [Acinetobacter sp. YQ_14]|uniref:GTP pyrophosphokinase n=1 Tax=Acinetobacter sp. YQ_14 TaxID=3367236 RepID=UPI00370B83E7